MNDEIIHGFGLSSDHNFVRTTYVSNKGADEDISTKLKSFEINILQLDTEYEEEIIVNSLHC